MSWGYAVVETEQGVVENIQDKHTANDMLIMLGYLAIVKKFTFSDSATACMVFSILSWYSSHCQRTMALLWGEYIGHIFYIIKSLYLIKCGAEVRAPRLGTRISVAHGVFDLRSKMR